MIYDEKVYLVVNKMIFIDYVKYSSVFEKMLNKEQCSNEDNEGQGYPFYPLIIL